MAPLTQQITSRVNVVLEQLPASADNVVLWWAGTCSRSKKHFSDLFEDFFFSKKKKHFEKARDMVRCSTVENHVRALLGPTSVPEETEVLHDGVRGGDWGAVVQWMWWNHMKFHGKHMETHLNRDFQTCFSKTQKVVQKFHKSDGWTWKWKNSRWTDSVLDFKSQFHRPRHPTIQPSQAKWLILKICVWHAGHIWHGVKGIVCAVWPQMLSGGTKFCGCHQSLAKRGAQFRLTWSTWWNSDSKRCPSCFF